MSTFAFIVLWAAYVGMGIAWWITYRRLCAIRRDPFAQVHNRVCELEAEIAQRARDAIYTHREEPHV